MDICELIEHGKKLINQMHDEYWKEEYAQSTVLDVVDDFGLDNLDRLAIMAALGVVIDAWMCYVVDEAVSDAVANGID